MTSRTWSWRHAVLKSNLPSTTKHVLLTIGCFMNEVGGGCYPTVKDLEEATGLTDRAVIKHIGIAHRLGWLDVKKHGFKGQRWKNNEYSAKWPDLVETLEQPQPKPRKTRSKPADEQAPEPVENSEENLFTAAENQAEGSEQRSLPQSNPEDGKVVNVVPKGSEPNSAKVVNHVHPILPDSFQNPSTRARERAGGREDFSKFWDGWPAACRPDNRHHAEKLFFALSPADRLIAAGTGPTFLRVMGLRRRPPLMIPFLKDRLFQNFHDGPPIDRDGDFVIRPDRPEWPAWLGDVRNTHGEDGVQHAIRSGLIVRKLRWPPGREPGRAARAEAAE